MLVSRDVDVDVTVTIELYFDDNTSKKFIIKRNDVISFTYRTKNGTINKAEGKVNSLRLTDRNIQYGVIEEFDITVDASVEYDSNVIVCSSNDILDIEYVEHAESGPQEILEDNMLLDADRVFIRLQDDSLYES